MTPASRDDLQRADMAADLPEGWRIDSPAVDTELMSRVRALESAPLSFRAWLELPPQRRHEPLRGAGSDRRPTILAQREMTGPEHNRVGRYGAMLLTVHALRSGAEDAAAARVRDKGRFVRRSIVEIEATGLRVVDARSIESLTSAALLGKDADAWQLLRTIRDEGAQAAWITSSSGSEETIGLFEEAIDRTLHVRAEEVYEFGASGGSRLVRAWLASTRSPTAQRAEQLVELSALIERLSRVMDPSYIAVWLRKPVPALDDNKPLEVIGRGEYRRVAKIVSALEESPTT